MVEVLKKELNYSFEEAVDHVKEEVSKGFSILLVQPIHEAIRNNLGIDDYSIKYTTILACGVDLTKAALDVSLNVGTLMPCSFVVYEMDGRVFVSHVSMMKIAAETGIADKNAMEPVIEQTGERVQKVWSQI